MSIELNADSGIMAAVAAAMGGGATLWARNRRTDKVDAVMAVANAFDKVAERNSAFTDDLQKQVQLLREEAFKANREHREEIASLNRELRKRDEMIFSLLSGRTRDHGMDSASAFERGMEAGKDSQESARTVPDEG